MKKARAVSNDAPENNEVIIGLLAPESTVVLKTSIMHVVDKVDRTVLEPINITTSQSKVLSSLK